MKKSSAFAPKLPLLLWWIVGLNLIIASLSFIVNFRGAEQGIVYVDAVRLIAGYKGMENIRKEADSRSDMYRKNLETLKTEVDQAVSNYENNKGKASERELALMQDLVMTKQKQFFDFDQSLKEQFEKQDRETSQRVLNEVNDYLKRYGEKKGYTIIMAATHYGNIAYANKSLDITDDVLKGLNEEFSKSNRQ